MQEPKIVERKGKNITLDEGDYSFCRCGLSADGVFCDGAHKGTGMVPKRFSLDHKQTVYLCMCKHTKNAPFL